ncbi:Fanconi anemia group F protein (FANCF) [Quillaja saponaria]|uniref:Fanconi anemia group F protein (FANCF) n=1 Tax=Quillaja saponaria TaxID=32244 RepID=A0AAD7VIW4_QUISA|nr:Fanconi anemia group F protein (FANCF) [Quillaja saponaria]
MGWNYPDVSLEDLMRLIKGFMDILILTSGYQSSGRIAYWDVQNIKRAFQWGFFFEKVFRYLGSSDVYEDSIRELDTALSEMKSNASFPQGLAHISSVTLANAQDFVSEHLINTLPLKVEHLRAFLTTVVEMDLDELSQAEDDCLTAYLNKLGLQDASHPLVPKKMGSSKDLDMLCPDIALNKVVKKSTGDYFTKYTVKTLLKRWSAMSCLSTVETGLHILFNCVKCMNWSESDITSLEGLQENDKAQRSAEQLVDFITWNQWKSNHLLYFLDRRTVRLVSGASMIFSAPKIQWVNVIEGLNVREESSDADISETIELLLLGSVAHRWNRLLEHLMSVSYYSLPISEQYHQVLNVLSGSCQSFHSKTEVMSSEENNILEYLTQLLGGQLDRLWKLSPALAAAAIPSWSALFRLYLSKLQTLMNTELSVRCCNCSQEGKEHSDCVIAERIWCFYIFHVWGSHLNPDLY